MDERLKKEMDILLEKSIEGKLTPEEEIRVNEYQDQMRERIKKISERFKSTARTPSRGTKRSGSTSKMRMVTA